MQETKAEGFQCLLDYVPSLEILFQSWDVVCLGCRFLSMLPTGPVLLSLDSRLDRLTESSQCVSRGWVCVRVCIGPRLGCNRVHQGHDDSLVGVLEGCYQVLDFPEKSFLHAGSSLKEEESREIYFRLFQWEGVHRVHL